MFRKQLGVVRDRLGAKLAVPLVACVIAFVMAPPPEAATAQTYSCDNWTYRLVGQRQAEDFGHVVAGVGDVDGDGADDILVAAPALCTACGKGRAYLYSGVDGTLLCTFEAEDAGDDFGFSVAGAGDVDGDTIPDLVVGAPFFNLTDGRVYVFDGDAAAHGNAVLLGDPFDGDGWQLGASVSTAGDVDNDGDDEIIVCAPYSGTDPPNNFGYEAIVYDLREGEWVAVVVLTGSTSVPNFGNAPECVGALGDVDGDGTGDVCFGEHELYYYQPPRAGSAFVYDASGGTIASYAGEYDDQQFGWSVKSAGDVDLDGVADLIVGAPDFGSPGGSAYVYSIAENELLYHLEGQTVFVHHSLGYSVSGAGDMNGDGFADVVIGDPLEGGCLTGVAFVYSGRTGELLYISRADSCGEQFGNSVSAGDFNDDGLGDVVVGAPTWSSGSFVPGAAYVFLGRATITCDMNCDGNVDAFDVEPFLQALSDPDEYHLDHPCCDRMAADCNSDGVIDSFDIECFIECLTG